MPQGNDSDLVEILNSNGKVIRTTRKAARLIHEANQYAQAGDMTRAVGSMQAAVSARQWCKGKGVEVAMMGRYWSRSGVVGRAFSRFSMKGVACFVNPHY